MDRVAGYGTIYEEAEQLVFSSHFLVEQTVLLLLQLLGACVSWL
jgi:hypothetical protein